MHCTAVLAFGISRTLGSIHWLAQECIGGLQRRSGGELRPELAQDIPGLLPWGR
jgi:hypothetical protein